MDLSTELTTSGAVNVTTRSGTNGIHGEAFDFFRDRVLVGWATPQPVSLDSLQGRSNFD